MSFSIANANDFLLNPFALYQPLINKVMLYLSKFGKL